MKILLQIIYIFFIACSSQKTNTPGDRWRHEKNAEVFLKNRSSKTNLLHEDTKYFRMNVAANFWHVNTLQLSKVKIPITHGVWTDPWRTMLCVDSTGGLWFFNPDSKNIEEKDYVQELIKLNSVGEIEQRKKIDKEYYTIFSFKKNIILMGNPEVLILDLAGNLLSSTNCFDQTKGFKNEAQWEIFHYVQNNEHILYRSFFAEKRNRSEKDKSKYKISMLYTITGTNYSISRYIEKYRITPEVYKKTFSDPMYNKYKDLRRTRLQSFACVTADVDRFGNYYLQSKTNLGHLPDIQLSGEIDIFDKHGNKLLTFKYPKEYPIIIQTRTAVSKSGVIYILYYNEKGVFIDKFVPDYLYKKHNGDLSKCI